MAHTQIRGELVKLKDTDLSIHPEGLDIRGFGVCDRGGEEIGKVVSLLVDTVEKKVRFVEIAHGGFLGIGEEKFVLPVDSVERIDDDVIHVNQDRLRIEGAPSYDPDLHEADYWERLYGYYGIPPYWGPGYVYPGFPFMR